MRGVDIAVALCEAEMALAEIDLRGHQEPIRLTTWKAVAATGDAYRKWLCRLVDQGVYPAALPLGGSDAEFRVRSDLWRLWESRTPVRINFATGFPAEPTASEATP